MADQLEHWASVGRLARVSLTVVITDYEPSLNTLAIKLNGTELPQDASTCTPSDLHFHVLRCEPHFFVSPR